MPDLEPKPSAKGLKHDVPGGLEVMDNLATRNADGRDAKREEPCIDDVIAFALLAS